MVYDESRNFVGDTHCRESDPVQDGDELQLDKGVLIQIGEETARVEQDLTELLEKRKRAPTVESSAAESMPNPTPHSLITASNPSASALRPKSLNVLLGTPKGRLGRAAVPQKSPFEVRRATQGLTATEERPAKRPRLQTDSNARVARESQSRSTSAVANHVKNISALQAGSVRERLVLPSEPTQDSAAPTPLRVPRVDNDDIQISTSRAHVLRKEREHNDSRKHSMKLPKTSSLSSTGPVNNDHDIGNISEKPNEAGQRKTSQANTSSRPTSQSPRPASRFRIASGKPRKKLMYKELLPEAAAINTHKSPPTTVFQVIDDDEATVERIASDVSVHPQSDKEDSSSQYHHDQRERIRKRLRKHERKKPVELDEEELAAMRETEVQSADAQPKMQPAAQAKNTKNCRVDIDATTDPVSSGPDRQQPPLIHLSDEEEQQLFCTQDDEQLEPTDETYSPKSHRLRAITPTTGHSQSPPESPPMPPLSLPHPPPPPAAAIPRPLPRGPLQRSHTVPSSVVARAQRTALKKSLSDAAKAQPKDDDTVSKQAYTKEAVALKPEPWSHEAWELFGMRREDVVKRVKEREKRRKNEGGKEEGKG